MSNPLSRWLDAILEMRDPEYLANERKQRENEDRAFLRRMAEILKRPWPKGRGHEKK